MSVDQDQFRAIISGRRRDATAHVARFLLGAASLGYRVAIGVRNTLYNWRVLRSHRAAVTVVSIGNLTTGGTGKTPLVVWLVKYLQGKGLRVAILTRGYKSVETRRVCTAHGDMKVGNAHPTDDEPAELASACPEVPVIVNADRVAGASEAIRHHDVQVLVMDDGFQHRRLARDLDIVAIDATVPFGSGHLLPAGLLREPLSGLRRAHAVVLTRSDQVDQETLEQTEATIHRVNPSLVVARAIHAPAAVELANGKRLDPTELADKRIFAFCGLGNPGAFFQTLQACGCHLIGQRVFNDHHHYSDSDIADLYARAQSSGAELLLTTQKDWTKVKPHGLPNGLVKRGYLVVELQITVEIEALTALIDQALASRIRPL
jgi:tetraacyldisaccharide 4'-kinase